MNREPSFDPDERRRDKAASRARDCALLAGGESSHGDLFKANSFILPANGKKGRIVQPRVSIRL